MLFTTRKKNVYKPIYVTLHIYTEILSFYVFRIIRL